MKLLETFNRVVVLPLAIALGMGGCAGITPMEGGSSNPCLAAGIDVRPVSEVSQGEMLRRESAGEDHYQHGAYHLFQTRSVTERFAPVAGALAVGALSWALVRGAGSSIGASTGAKAGAAAIGGAFGGAVAGDMLSGATRVQRLARQNGCEDYVDKLSGGRQVGRTSVPAVDTGYPTYSVPYSRSRGFYDNPGPFVPYRYGY